MRIPVKSDPTTGTSVSAVSSSVPEASSTATPAASSVATPAASSVATPAAVSGPAGEWGPTLFRAGAVGLGVIWASVALISVFSPDMVTGSEQDHLPIAAILTWVWGLVASRSLVTALVARRDRPGRAADVWLLVGVVAAVWAAAALVAVFTPTLVTGADPTTIPIGAILAPVAAMVLTTTLCQVHAALVSPDDRS